MRKLHGVIALLCLCQACTDAPLALDDATLTPAFAAVGQTSSTRVDFDIGVFIPCADGGAGEPALLSGTLHVLIHSTFDNAGGAHIKSHFQPQRLTGVGAVTGARYQGTGVTQEMFNSSPGGLPFTTTYINNFRMIGQGPGNNFLIHQVGHLTINANGVVTASVDELNVECK